jgi:hypothetical protein
MTDTTPARHFSEMTLAEIEAFEKANRLSVSHTEAARRRGMRAQIDAVALARRAEREASGNGR